MVGLPPVNPKIVRYSQTMTIKEALVKEALAKEDLTVVCVPAINAAEANALGVKAVEKMDKNQLA